METEKPDRCDECEYVTDDLHKHTWTEQEYPGACYWKFTDWLCEGCLRKKAPDRGVQENFRGW